MRSSLMIWYRDTFFPEHTGDPDFPDKRVFGMLTNWQIQYNAAARKPCRGMSFMKLKSRPQQYCKRPLCPTCWHLRNQDMISALERVPMAPYYYIRDIGWYQYNQPIPKRCLQYLKGDGSRYSMIGYLPMYIAASRVITEEVIQYDSYQGQLGYGIRGAFLADRLVQDSDDPEYPDISHVFLNQRDHRSEVLAAVHRSVFRNRESLLDSWVAGLTHPFMYHQHDVFPRYVKYFEENAVFGRAWSRIRVTWKRRKT